MACAWRTSFVTVTFAVVTSWAAYAASTVPQKSKPSDKPAPPSSEPVQATRAAEVCQTALLHNGFTIQFARQENENGTARLWLCAAAGSGYVEVAQDQIERTEYLSAAEPVSAAEPAPTPPSTNRVPMKPQPGATGLETMISKVASRHQIDPDFVASVIKAESAFNPGAISPKGARGLMQLMPATATELGVTNVFDPASNLEGGTRYLRQLIDRYHGDAAKALAAYNAGPQRVDRYGGIPPYRETFDYVARIIEDFNRKKLRQQAHAAAVQAEPTK